MEQKFSLAYSCGTEYYYYRNSVQSGLFIQLVICFCCKNLFQGD